MKYQKLLLFFFFITFCTNNLSAQEIKIKFDRSTCQLNENIYVRYEIPVEFKYKRDSIQKLDLNQFDKIGGPANTYSATTKDKTVTSYQTAFSYSFKAITLGKQKLPQLFVLYKGQILKSPETYVTVVNDPSVKVESKFKEYIGGHLFHISLPFYMRKTSGINSYSAIEYTSIENNVFGSVIYETKENLALSGETYSSINDFCKSLVDDFFEQQEKEASKPVYFTKGLINFMETDVSYYDKERKQKFYYFIGVAETKTTFYTFISWVPIERKNTFKADFQQILYSIKD
ncbi:hypothetical protein [Flavobacterium ginsenosidimutans]|uniref:Uncharacterized protein n=1 Tax=Flavobacterium ginsenosidimutans TaxID=687844 RepID=A0ABZ2Q4C0_9FLAO